MSRTPEEEKHTEVKKVIGGVDYIKCSVCFNFFRTEGKFKNHKISEKIIKLYSDLNRHLWSHAWTKYESLPARKQSGRFKQLMKFVSKQYKGIIRDLRVPSSADLDFKVYGSWSKQP